MNINRQRHAYWKPSANTEIDETVKGCLRSVDGLIKCRALFIGKHHDSTLPCIEKFWDE